MDYGNGGYRKITGYLSRYFFYLIMKIYLDPEKQVSSLRPGGYDGQAG